MVNHDVAHHGALEQLGMQIGLLKTAAGAFANLRAAASQQFARMLKLLSPFGIGCQPGIKVTRVVGIELLLDDGFGGNSFTHTDGSSQMVGV